MEQINPDAPNFSIMPLVQSGMIICEIGVAEGVSSENFLKAGCILYMVDPWIAYEAYTETAYKHDVDYQKTLDKVKNFGTYKIIRKKSDDAIEDVPNDLDLVYIDGNHAYEFVKRDILNYWLKVKRGGWLTGDDISMPEVAGAVLHGLAEIARENPGISVTYFGRNWGIQKP